MRRALPWILASALLAVLLAFRQSGDGSAPRGPYGPPPEAAEP